MAGDLGTAHPGEARLRAALAAAASGPVAPAWDDIRARVVAGDPAGLALVAPVAADPTRAPAPPRRGRGRALVAAAAVLVVALAGLALATRTGGDAEVTEVGAPVDGTGFYVPVDLPSGWHVTSVVARRADRPRCPGPEEEPARGVRWVRGDAAITFFVGTAEICGAPDSHLSPGGGDVNRGAPGDGVSVELGELDGWLLEAPGRSDRWVTWDLDGVERVLRADGISGDELVAVARTLIAAGEPATPPEGFAETDRWTQPVVPDTTVTVELTAPDGSVVAYDVTQAGGGIFRDLPTTQPVEGTELLRVSNPSEPWQALYGIEGRMVDVVVWGFTPPSAGGVDPPPAARAAVGDAAELLARSLRPATAEQWRDLVAGADRSTPVLADADSFDALVGGAVPPGEEPATTVATVPRETVLLPSTSVPG